jgi:hypothetical protein
MPCTTPIWPGARRWRASSQAVKPPHSKYYAWCKAPLCLCHKLSAAISFGSTYELGQGAAALAIRCLLPNYLAAVSGLVLGSAVPRRRLLAVRTRNQRPFNFSAALCDDSAGHVRRRSAAPSYGQSDQYHDRVIPQAHARRLITACDQTAWE